MSSHAQRPRPEQIEKLVTKLAEDVHSAVGGKPFPAKLIQTAVSVLSSEKAVSTEKWERVIALIANAMLCSVMAVHVCEAINCLAHNGAGCSNSKDEFVTVCSKRGSA